MQLHNISSTIHGQWEHDNCSSHISDINNIKEVCNAFHPHITIKLDNSNLILNEATYKEIASLIDSNFLKQKIRADELNGITIHGFEDNIMNFLINSSEFEKNHIKYMCSVLFKSWDEVGNDPDLNFREQALMLLWVGDIKLNCTCPSFLYWGYQYLLTTLDSSIYPETRVPHIRNPQQRGIVCKHLNRILRVLPFYSGKIASELKRQFS